MMRYWIGIAACLCLLNCSPAFAQLTAHELYNRGVRYIQDGNLEAALSDFNQTIKYDPKYADAYYNRAYVYTKLNDFESALQDYDRTVELNDKNAEYLLMRGNAYYFLDRYPEALLDYTRAIEIDTSNAQPYFYRGITLLEYGEDADGCIDLKKAAAKGFFNAKRAYSDYCGGD